MWATGTRPFAIDSSTMAVRISGGMMCPGSAISVIHILVKWTPCAANPRTNSRASSGVSGWFALFPKPPGVEKPKPARVSARKVGPTGVGLEQEGTASVNRHRCSAR